MQVYIEISPLVYKLFEEYINKLFIVVVSGSCFSPHRPLEHA